MKITVDVLDKLRIILKLLANGQVQTFKIMVIVSLTRGII